VSPVPVPANPWARWALDTLERGARAYAAAWVAIVGGDYVLEQWNATFAESLKAAFFGLVVSSLFSLAGKTQGADDSASFLPENTDPPQP
jgi:hypothetical protein